MPNLDPAERSRGQAELEQGLADADVLTYYLSHPGRQAAATLRALAVPETYLELSREAERIGRGLIGDVKVSAAVTGVEAPPVDEP
ncbi:hypothetical protein [Streptomyces sp. NPDC013171]